MAQNVMYYAKKYGTVGAVAAVASGFILKGISQAASIIPGVTVDLQSISITTSDIGGVVGTGLNKYMQKLLGVLPISMPEWVMIALGGALFVMLGGLIYESQNMFKAKTEQGRLAAILVAAGIVSGWILAMAVSIPVITGIIIMAINAYVLSWILIGVDNLLGGKLIKI